jgi:hypothetical protein
MRAEIFVNLGWRIRHRKSKCPLMDERPVALIVYEALTHALNIAREHAFEIMVCGLQVVAAGACRARKT